MPEPYRAWQTCHTSHSTTPSRTTRVDLCSSVRQVWGGILHRNQVAIQAGATKHTQPVEPGVVFPMTKTYADAREPSCMFNTWGAEGETIGGQLRQQRALTSRTARFPGTLQEPAGCSSLSRGEPCAVTMDECQNRKKKKKGPAIYGQRVADRGRARSFENEKRRVSCAFLLTTIRRAASKT